MPVVAGNVSLYNETNGESIPPTPQIGAVGIIDNLNKYVPNIPSSTSDQEIILHACMLTYACLCIGTCANMYSYPLSHTSVIEDWAPWSRISVRLPVCQHVCLYVCLPACLSACRIPVAMALILTDLAMISIALACTLRDLVLT